MAKKIFTFAAMLLLLSLNFGCSDVKTAEKRLGNELKFFAGQYIKNEFVKQIKLNSECKAFQINENKLLLLAFDGIDVVQRTLPYNDLHEFAVSRYYVGQELNIVCNEASWSNLTAVNHDKYSYRALVTFKFTDIRRMWQRIPGNSIAFTIFKNSATADQIKFELLNKAVSLLPDERFDYYSVYFRNVQIQERKFTTSIFVCYDPALPGWVPEDPVLAGEITVDASKPDWLECSIDKFQHSGMLERYKDDFYWNKSKLIRKNYDEGLVFRYNRWMPLAEAEETARLEDLVNKFDPARASIEELTAFLLKLKGFSPQMNLTNAIQKAVVCAENQINILRNNNNYRALEQFNALMQGNSAYAHVFAAVKDNIMQAITIVKRRVNRQLNDAIAEINAVLSAMLKLDNRKLTANQINIECVRQENILKNLCKEDFPAVSALLFQIRFLQLLSKQYLDDVNRLYKHYDQKEQLVKLEQTVLNKCKNCRKGVQKCIYCSNNPRICSECGGKRNILSDEKCATCNGTALCVHCRGKGSMNCMNCSGRGFVILHSKVKECLQKSISDLEKILKNYITDLENKKLVL